MQATHSPVHLARQAIGLLRRLGRRLTDNLAKRGAPERAAAVGLVALALFASPLLVWWSSIDGRSWYLPFVVWAAVIVLGLVIERLARHDV